MAFGATYHLVFDFANFSHRCATTPMGTGAAVHLALKSLLSWKRQFGGALVFALEGENQTERYALHPTYKGDRADRASASSLGEIHAAQQSVLETVRTLRCSCIRIPGYEADDAIAAFCVGTKQKTVVVSADADLWVLAGLPHVEVYTDNPSSNMTAGVTLDRIQHKFRNVLKGRDLPFEAIPLFKSIYGDSSDHIPRVPRIPYEVIAPGLIASRNPDDFFAWVQQSCEPKTRAKLLSYMAQIRTMYDVVRLRTEFPVITESFEGDPGSLDAMCVRHGCQEILQSGNGYQLCS